MYIIIITITIIMMCILITSTKMDYGPRGNISQGVKWEMSGSETSLAASALIHMCVYIYICIYLYLSLYI